MFKSKKILMYFSHKKRFSFIIITILLITLSSIVLGGQKDNDELINLRGDWESLQEDKEFDYQDGIPVARRFASYYARNRQYRLAEFWLKKAIKLSGEFYGEKHPNTANSYARLAKIYMDFGDLNKAKAIISNAIKSYEITDPGSEKYLPEIFGIHSLILLQMGKFNEARVASNKAIEVAIRVFGKENKKTIKWMSDFVNVLVGLEEYKAALPVAKKINRIYQGKYGDKDIRVAYSLIDLGFIYNGLNIHAEGRRLIEKAYKIANQYFDEKDAGLIYFHRAYALMLSRHGHFNESLALYKRVAQDFERLYGTNSPYTIQNQLDILSLHKALGEYGKAAKLTDQLMQTSKHVFDKNKYLAGEAYQGFAGLYERLGDYDLAESFINKAINSRQDNASQRSDLVELQARIYSAQGKMSDAVAVLQQLIGSLEIKHGKSNYLLVSPLTSLCAVYLDIKDYKKAKQVISRAMAIYENVKVKNKVTESNLYNNLAIINEKTGEYDKAINAYQKALILSLDSTRSDSYSEAILFYNLGASHYWKNNKNAAIVLFKKAINIFQEKRHLIKTVEPKLKVAFLQSQKDVYQALIKALYDESRVPEALTVYKMLKETEYLEYIRGASDDGGQVTQVPFTREETDWVKEYDILVERYANLNVELPGGNAIDAYIEKKSLFAEKIKGKLVQLASFKQKSVNKIASLQGQLIDIDLKKGQANLYYAISDDALNITIQTNEGVIHKKVNEKWDDLSIKLHDFIKIMNRPSEKPFAVAKNLYDLLIKPIKTILDDQKVKSLHVSLDGMLRYISMAALYDGNHYLIEKYDITLVSPIDMKNKIGPVEAQFVKEKLIVGFGVTKAYGGFSPLSAVENELDQIVKINRYDFSGHLPGNVYIDEAFSKKSLTQALRSKVDYLHFATHFVLDPVSLDHSYLLLGKGEKLMLSGFRSDEFSMASIDMLTLSACETAVGTIGADGSEIESFAVASLKQGVKSVLASLWKVPDKSTSTLLINVYENIFVNPEKKSRALAKAQRSMIRNDKNRRFGHPHYWAAFVLYESI